MFCRIWYTIRIWYVVYVCTHMWHFYNVSLYTLDETLTVKRQWTESEGTYTVDTQIHPILLLPTLWFCSSLQCPPTCICLLGLHRNLIQSQLKMYCSFGTILILIDTNKYHYAYHQIDV